jgi:hypothetical protein
MTSIILLQEHALFEHQFWMDRILTEQLTDEDEAMVQLTRLLVPAKTLFNDDAVGVSQRLKQFVNSQLSDLVSNYLKDPEFTDEELEQVAKSLKVFSKQLMQLYSTETLARVVSMIGLDKIKGKLNLPLLSIIDKQKHWDLLNTLKPNLQSVIWLKTNPPMTPNDLVLDYLKMSFNQIVPISLAIGKSLRSNSGMEIITQVQHDETGPQQPATRTQMDSGVRVKQSSISTVKNSFGKAFAQIPPEDRKKIPPSVASVIGRLWKTLQTLEQTEQTSAAG